MGASFFFNLLKPLIFVSIRVNKNDDPKGYYSTIRQLVDGFPEGYPEYS